jgi:CheY-like chemotaxis protein
MGGLHALVIEDEALVALLIQDALFDVGFGSVDCVSNVDDARRSFAQRRPDLITADCRLPNNLDGLAFALELVGGTSIPVVAITGTTYLADGHPQVPVVPKPFTANDLLRAISAVGILLPRAIGI